MLRVLTILFFITLFVSCDSNDEITQVEEVQSSITTLSRSSDNDYLNELISSPTYNGMDLSNYFSENLSTIIDTSKFKIAYLENENNEEIPMISLPIFKSTDNKLVGSLDAVRQIDSIGNIDYVILFRNFEEMDFDSGSGEVFLVDVNLDYKYVTFTIEEYEIMEVVPHGDFIDESELDYSKVNPFDTNGDGNVTFSECYFTANSACGGDPECYTVCYGIGDAAGWVITTAGPLCQSSIALACVYISIKY